VNEPQAYVITHKATKRHLFSRFELHSWLCAEKRKNQQRT